MTIVNDSLFTWLRHMLSLTPACMLFIVQPAFAATPTSERTQLALIMRQLDMLNRLAQQAAALPHEDSPRYHFNYLSLRHDVQRIRAGVQDYLSPQRTQPRDPIPLIGDYRREAETTP